MSAWGHRAVAVAGIAGLLAAGTALPAQAGKDRVVRGHFALFDIDPKHPEPRLHGRAQLVRTGSGKTKLSVHVKGLSPGRTYGVHLHNKACDDGAGGGHYQNVESPEAAMKRPPNELWASSDRHDPEAGITANRAGNASGHGVAAWTARSTARSVVIHIAVHHGGTTAGGTKLACADLR